MPKRKLNWKLWTKDNRNHAIDHLKAVLSDGGGSIIHFQRFSDLGLGLTAEVEECDIYNIYQRMNDYFQVEGALPEDLDSSSENEWWLLIHLTFASGTGDFKVEVPAVPS